MLPWLIALTVLFLIPGILYALAFVPPEKYQGNSYRIMYIHVPSASIAMGGYAMMAIAGVIVLVWRMKMAEMVAKSLAPIGASLRFCAW